MGIEPIDKTRIDAIVVKNVIYGPDLGSPGAGYDDFKYQIYDMDGIDGQGHTKRPQKVFNNHAVVEYRGIIYDPSYGKKWPSTDRDASLALWETNSLAGYRCKPYNTRYNKNPSGCQVTWEKAK
ncbi:hypothetical protein BVX99_02765 [bacterium F16]|nr:hypothetical protein BVX99_02765 [bacterium F16]